MSTFTTYGRMEKNTPIDHYNYYNHLNRAYKLIAEIERLLDTDQSPESSSRISRLLNLLNPLLENMKDNVSKIIVEQLRRRSELARQRLAAYNNGRIPEVTRVTSTPPQSIRNRPKNRTNSVYIDPYRSIHNLGTSAPNLRVDTKLETASPKNSHPRFEFAPKGYLLKQGEKGFKFWRRRYFRLVGTLLSYSFYDEENEKPINSIDLAQVLEVRMAKGHRFDIHTLGRIWHLEADNTRMAQKWVKALLSRIRQRPLQESDFVAIGKSFEEHGDFNSDDSDEEHNLHYNEDSEKIGKSLETPTDYFNFNRSDEKHIVNDAHFNVYNSDEDQDPSNSENNNDDEIMLREPFVAPRREICMTQNIALYLDAQLKEENDKLKSEIDELKSEIALQEFRIPLHELTFGERIGSGGFGDVHKGEWHGQAVAIKKLRAEHIGQEVVDSFVKEARTLMRLRHKHIVMSMGITRDSEHADKDLMIVMEFMKQGSLAHLLFKQRMQLQRHQIIQIALDVAKGLNYLHSLTPKIIHRDIKCENILISDFGTAKQLSHASKVISANKPGTPHYMAPEALAEKDYDEKVDVYAFGIVLFAMVTNTVLPILEEKDRLARIANSIPNDIDLKKLICACCQNDPDCRPTIRQCLNWLKNMKKGKKESTIMASNMVPVDIHFDELEFGDQIGQEPVATVHKAQWRGMKVVVKKRIRSADNLSYYEVSLLKKLCHKNIVKLVGFTTKLGNNDLMLVMEYMKEGSLADLLHKQQATLNQVQVLQIGLDIAEALDYLHSLTPQIIHRDVASANILLYANWSHAKISNFAKAASQAKRQYRDPICGSSGFMAPEIMNEQRYDEKIDVYSFGTVLLEMATRIEWIIPLNPAHLKSTIEKTLDNSPTWRSVTQFRKLVLSCCQFEPKNRPLMRQCIVELKSLLGKYKQNTK